MGLLFGGGAMGSGKPRKIITRKIGNRQKNSGVRQFSLRFIIRNSLRQMDFKQGLAGKTGRGVGPRAVLTIPVD